MPEINSVGTRQFYCINRDTILCRIQSIFLLDNLVLSDFLIAPFEYHINFQIHKYQDLFIFLN